MEELYVTTDGAAALTGIRKGFWCTFTETVLHTKFIHCMVQRQAIAAKKWEPDYTNGCIEVGARSARHVIDVVNIIKTRP